MVVTLSPQTEALIQQKVNRGEYEDANELVERAVQLLDEHDRRQRLIAALAKGEEGEAIEWTPELSEQLSRSAEERFRRGELPDPDVCP
jgi:putative addiction module CopG family antidote